MFKKKIIIFTCLLAAVLFAENAVDIEMMALIERMRAVQNINNKRDVYFSNKIIASTGKYYDIFGASMEIGAVNYQRNILLAAELSGGYRNWGAGLNMGYLLKLGDIQFVVPGMSSGFWFAMNDDYYNYQFILGGPFVKYLIGKDSKFFEISVRANMGWTDAKVHYYSDRWGWDYRYEDKFLINANFSAGLTFLF